MECNTDDRLSNKSRSELVPAGVCTGPSLEMSRNHRKNYYAAPALLFSNKKHT